MLNQTVGKNLKKLRELKNYSQEAVSVAMDMSHVTYNKIENGKGIISLDRLEKFASFFNVDIETILNFPENKLYNRNTSTSQELEEESVQLKYMSGENAKYKEEISSLKEKVKLLEEKVEDKETIISLLKGDIWKEAYQQVNKKTQTKK